MLATPSLMAPTSSEFPPEIQVNIYRYCLPIGDTIFIDESKYSSKHNRSFCFTFYAWAYTSPSWCRRIRPRRHPSIRFQPLDTALLRTSRQVRFQCLDHLLRSNDIDFHSILELESFYQTFSGSTANLRSLVIGKYFLFNDTPSAGLSTLFSEVAAALLSLRKLVFCFGFLEPNATPRQANYRKRTSLVRPTVSDATAASARRVPSGHQTTLGARGTYSRAGNRAIFALRTGD